MKGPAMKLVATFLITLDINEILFRPTRQEM
jgi:hypothetical protein